MALTKALKQIVEGLPGDQFTQAWACTQALKQIIEGLPGDLFTQVWKCIEEIDAALDKAGPTALLAMKYCQEQHGERTAQLLVMQQTDIEMLKRHSAEDADIRKRNAREFAALKTEYERTYKRLERLKKKTSKK